MPVVFWVNAYSLWLNFLSEAIHRHNRIAEQVIDKTYHVADRATDEFERIARRGM